MARHLHESKVMHGLIKNEVGNKYSRLLVIEQAEYHIQPSGKREIQWLCKCSCGNEVVTLGASLRRGVTKSCGCLQKERVKKAISKPIGVAAFNRVYGNSKRMAAYRGLNWELTKEQFREITQQDCFYCGELPNQGNKLGGYYNGTYVYNGVDRVDNSKGYTIDNCVPCCKTCNWMKSDMGIEEFYIHIEKIFQKVK